MLEEGLEVARIYLHDLLVARVIVSGASIYPKIWGCGWSFMCHILEQFA
jgi:hypothetical protein